MLLQRSVVLKVSKKISATDATREFYRKINIDIINTC